jgi:N-acetylmuramate 1-kinase
MPTITPDTLDTSKTSESQDPRLQQLRNWLDKEIEYEQIHALEQDASFRRYFRVTSGKKSYIVMDAPPEKEPCLPFAAIADALENIGVNVPLIYGANLEKGFLLLTDFGNSLYLDNLNPDSADKLYGRAMQELLKIQKLKTVNNYKIPKFDRKEINIELENFRHWYLGEFCGFKLNDDEHKTLDNLFAQLTKSAITQTQVFTHRDYHSRNLMIANQKQAIENNYKNIEIGILDFQDAVWGPVTYDLVSMIRDCYIVWPDEKVAEWLAHFHQQLIENGTIDVDLETSTRWFDLMGMQRHLKAIFIFARKYLRDKDKRYLDDIPRGLHYVQNICQKYPELNDFYKLLCAREIPGFA